MRRWVRPLLTSILVVAISMLVLITWYTLVSPFSAIDTKSHGDWWYSAQLLGILWLAPAVITVLCSATFDRFSAVDAPGYQLMLTDLLSALVGSGVGYTVLITVFGSAIRILFLSVWMQYMVVGFVWLLICVCVSYIVRKWIVKRHN